MIGLARGSYARARFWRKNRRALVQCAASCCAVACLLIPVMGAQAEDINYGYDALGRLTSVTVAGASVYYDYDSAGNITAIRRQGTLSAAGPESDASPSHISHGGVSPLSPASTQASVR
jgi:YD repeat-containing protein